MTKLEQELKWYKLYADNVQATDHRAHEYACEWANLQTQGVECHDCFETYMPDDLRPWRYEPEIKLCESCIETRDEEEEDG
jgi:hypothetical protein